jgi:predicted nucleic acid-binding Zn ribbon protein
MNEKKSQKPFTAADVLQRLFENSKSPLSDGFQRWRLESQWESIVGATMGKHSRPIQFDKGTLVVEVTNSVWLQEIRFFIDDIKTKVNQHKGYNWVERIHLVHK